MNTSYMRSTHRIVVNRIRKSITEDMLCHNDETGKPFTASEVMDAFYNWYGEAEQKRYPNRVKAFEEWLRALPSELELPFHDHDMETTLKVWLEGTKPLTSKRNHYTQSLMWTRFSSLMWRELNKMAKLEAKGNE